MVKFVQRFPDFDSSRDGRFDLFRKVNGLWQAIDWEAGKTWRSESRAVCVEWCQAQVKTNMRGM